MMWLNLKLTILIQLKIITIMSIIMSMKNSDESIFYETILVVLIKLIMV